MLIIDKLTKVYNNKYKALQDFSAKIPSGEIVALAGPNGSGKTTLINAVLNIIKPTSGMVRLDHATSGTKEFNEKIAYVPDELMLPQLLTAEEYFDFISSMYDQDTKDKRDKLIEVFDMKHSLTKSIETFSHGMQKKTQLISSFMLNVDFIILDEPFSGLDIEAVFVLKKLMRHFVSSEKGILVATHDLHAAEELCDRVAIISKGIKVADGKIIEMLHDYKCASLEELFLVVSNLRERSAEYEKIIESF